MENKFIELFGRNRRSEQIYMFQDIDLESQDNITNN
jgi:hypothetical protein